MVEIDHDIYERFCHQARRRNVSPEEEAKRVITARALEDGAPEVAPKQNVRGNRATPMLAEPNVPQLARRSS
jgi:hypothetical protein